MGNYLRKNNRDKLKSNPPKHCEVNLRKQKMKDGNYVWICSKCNAVFIGDSLGKRLIEIKSAETSNVTSKEQPEITEE